VASSLIYETIEWAVAVIIGPDAAMGVSRDPGRRDAPCNFAAPIYLRLRP